MGTEVIMARKKKTEEQIIEEVSKLVAEETLTAEKTKSKKTKDVWPKITKGTHSTFIEHEDGTVEMQTDWVALGNEINQAIASLETTQQTKTKKVKQKG